MNGFRTVDINEIKENPFEMIGKKWMLVAAAKDEKINAMTASWGGFGVMWGKNVAFIVIRPQRYTKEFIDASEGLSLTFYGEDMRKMMSYMGSVSGRDENKIKKMGLTVKFDDGIPYFEEAEMVITAKKLYRQTFSPECMIDTDIDRKWYPEKDYHDLYICEIEKAMVR